MPEIGKLIPYADARLEVFRAGRVAAGPRRVLLWAQGAKRAVANPAANLAVAFADLLGVPVVVAFCLVPGYPRATLLSYLFMAEGLRELPVAFVNRGIGNRLHIGDPPEVVPRLAEEVGAAAVVADQNPLRLGRAQRRSVAAGL